MEPSCCTVSTVWINTLSAGQPKAGPAFTYSLGIQMDYGKYLTLCLSFLVKRPTLVQRRSKKGAWWQKVVPCQDCEHTHNNQLSTFSLVPVFARSARACVARLSATRSSELAGRLGLTADPVTIAASSFRTCRCIAASRKLSYSFRTLHHGLDDLPPSRKRRNA